MAHPTYSTLSSLDSKILTNRVADSQSENALMHYGPYAMCKTHDVDSNRR